MSLSISKSSISTFFFIIKIVPTFKKTNKKFVKSYLLAFFSNWALASDWLNQLNISQSEASNIIPNCTNLHWVM